MEVKYRTHTATDLAFLNFRIDKLAGLYKNPLSFQHKIFIRNELLQIRKQLLRRSVATIQIDRASILAGN